MKSGTDRSQEEGGEYEQRERKRRKNRWCSGLPVPTPVEPEASWLCREHTGCNARGGWEAQVNTSTPERDEKRKNRDTRQKNHI